MDERVTCCDCAYCRETVLMDNWEHHGQCQINDKWHPEVSDNQAYDIIESTKFFCKAFKEGNLYWWDASKKCWNKEN